MLVTHSLVGRILGFIFLLAGVFCWERVCGWQSSPSLRDGSFVLPFHFYGSLG